MSRIKNLFFTGTMMVSFLLSWAYYADALKAPHNSTRSIFCSDCHSPTRQKFITITSNQVMCFSQQWGCHNAFASGTSAAGKKRFTRLNASNRFGHLTAIPNAKQSSHGWKIPNVVPEAGVVTGWNPGQPYSFLTKKIFCSRCHMAHGEHPAGGFLRETKKGDYICLRCHTARRVGAGSARSPLAPGKHYSHPVEVNYSSVRGEKPDSFETSPQLAAGYSESARPRLYTTIGGVKGSVVCSTCHGPLHAADSNPYTFDGLSSYSQGNYSTSAGNLLRQYPMSKSNNLCTSCHKMLTHQTATKCYDCHVPHKGPGDNNIFLIRTSIQTPNSGKRSVQFISTTEMADRWSSQGAADGKSNAICEVCHTTTASHRNMSTAGVPRETSKMGEYLGGGKYRNCTGCHSHANGFPKSGGGCNGCHGASDGSTAYPSDAAYGKHQKHIGTGSASYSWSAGTLADSRSAGAYGFSCGRCHSPFARYTDSQHFAGTAAGNYTTDIGFKHKSILPNNTGASYLYGATGGIDLGRLAGPTWRYPGGGANDGLCRNLYCHGQFYNGYTGFNPNWQGTAPCGKCHGATQELGRGLPGNMKNSTNYGAHPRHVGGATEQGYGQGSANFRCNACHALSATQNAISSIGLDRRYHVNGKLNLKFYSSFGYAASTYGTYNNYSASISTAVTKPAYKTCGLIYCHSDGSRQLGNYSAPFNAGVGTGTARFPNWSGTRNFTTTVATIGGKARCARCHGNTTYHGITAAMPGVTSKGNSHSKHIANGFLCSVCHSGTVNTDNKSILSTMLHVNKAYNISILTKYGSSASYDSGTRRCSNVKCHGGRVTAQWGDQGRCQDCHFKSSAEAAQDEGYSDSYVFRNYTDTTSVPRIYSTEWTKVGHGRSSDQYPSGNNAANRSCYYGSGGTGCHKDPNAGAKSHQLALSGNTYRLYTGYGTNRSDVLCNECHKTGGSREGEVTNSKRVLGHFTSGNAFGDARWGFTPKCIDCHDPHGDKNRYMVQKYINYSGSDQSGKRGYDLTQSSGLMNFSTVGGGLMNWSSYVNSGFSGICQRCHNTQPNQAHFNKGGLYDTGHNARNRCTNCHKHEVGFKPLDCNKCHYFPPTLSGKHAFHVATSVPKNYVGWDLASTKTKYAFGCGKCHDTPQVGGTHYTDSGAMKVYTADLIFDGNDSLPRNASGQYAYGNKSSVDDGADDLDDFKWISTKGTCKNLYCHGQFFGGYTGNDPSWYNAAAISPDDPQICGKCHGAVKNGSNSPSGGAHNKHVTTYSFKCRFCHRDTTGGFDAYTVANRSFHVNGITDIRLYTTESRIKGNARYGSAGSEYINVTTNNTPGSAPNYRYCKNIYCHSNGTNFVTFALPNYTAKWSSLNLPASAGEKCSYCHGSKNTAGGYAGITSAMPNYISGKINSHKKHVVDNGFSCYACHANTVDSTGRAISSSGVSTYHVNKVYDVAFPAAYSGIYNGDNTCSRVKCHGKRKTPAWGGTVACTNCHFKAEGAADADNMDYSFRNYSNLNSVPKIYSGEWMASGHGKTGSNYNWTNNPPAGKICSICHVSSVKHNTGSNFFRLTGLGGTSDPSTLCKRCHGKSIERDAAWMGNRTGIQGHTQQILSSEGYTNLTTWRFKPKCTDCHDPHGDAQASSGNIAMIRNTYLYNYSGSDNSGKPVRFGSLTTVFFEKYTGTRSFDDASGAAKGRLCAACHKRTAHNGTDGGGHSNERKDCRTCHTHKKGFTPAGCTGCHGSSVITIDRANWAPPKGPTGWSDSLTNMSSAHRPHAYNPRRRPGFGNQTGFACQYCHDDTVPSTLNHNQVKDYANLSNMTSTTGWNGLTKASKVDYGTGVKNPANDTCSNTKCHTPRVYTRTWQKPKDCDDCHGYTKGRGTDALTGRQFNLQTTQSHKIHINWTGIATPPASWKKNYKFACKNCHYDWQTNNNYSTHYSGQVNITSGGLVNTVGGAFYTRGRLFKGFTTVNETLGTCSKTYCHGNFANGTAITKPNWKKGVTPVSCGSCHRAKTGKVAGWSDGSQMPAPHPKHVASTAGNYNFTCSRCHVWTVTNNTTVQFTYSSHVNTRKDVNFENTSGGFDNTSKMCQNTYCHSSGATVTPRTVSNYTAEWDKTVLQKTGAGKECSYCHGSKGNGFVGITAAMPNYANQAHAKHARNTTGDNFKCYVCHAATVDASGAIISNINHVNKFKNISIISTYKSGQTGYSSTVPGKKTCKNVKCHGGVKTPLWTLTTGINCMDCHKSMTGDTDKRIKEINVYQSFSAAGSTAPKIYSTTWADRGHGRQSADGVYDKSGNSPANKTCTNCHGAGETRAGGLATKHGTGNNPFRLITAPGRPNVLCESCHGTNATNPGKGARVGIQTHASSVSKQGQNFAIKCIDCHDPHGDNNIYMVHSTISRPNTALSVKSQISNNNGSILTTATTLRNVDFVNNVYTSDYAKKTQAPKICQTCHRETQKPRSSTYQRYRWNGSTDNQHGTTKCTGCHSHDSGFKGVRCDGCHGNPPTVVQTILSGTNRTNEFKERPSGNTSSEANTPGAHLKHVQVFGYDAVTCSYCHQGGMYGSGSKNSNIDIGFRAFSVYSGYTQNYNGQAAVKSGFYGYSGYGVGAGTNQKCNNMKCHGGGGWLTASYGVVTAPTWTATNSASCGKCHGAKKAASSGSWPMTYAHPTHAGTGIGIGQANLMCNVCHATTVIANNTTLSDTMHVNGRANIGFGNEFRVHSTTSSYSDDGNYVNNGVVGKCTNTYCHSKGTDSDMIVPFNNAADYANWTATWNDVRGTYKKANGQAAKCNYCHGNKTWSGTTSAMPNYPDGSPKANKHPKHVKTYNFLCNACHVDVARNNTSITSSSLHINRAYDVNYTTVRTIVNNSAGSYMTGRCENLYCHSLGNIASAALPNYTAKWAADMITGGYKTGLKCKYCHGSKTGFTGMTAAMPNYPTGTPKANAHNRHVAKYGFTCTECHMKVTTNNSSIDAAGGSGLHVNKQYNVYFKPAIGGRPQINNTGIYKYQSGATGSSCKNTYCHSRGTDFVRPYSTRTSFSNFTAQWGDIVGGYKKAAGNKAKCNYCHGNRLFSGMTSAMPNYSTQIKRNSHKRHVVGYGFTCKACHKYVTTNNSSIDAAGGTGRHVNGEYNVNFSNSFNNNTGLYNFIGLNSLNRCNNTYCHSRGTDFTRPFNTRTSFSNFTAMWGDTLGTGGYKQARGVKAKCNYCHGNKAYSGTTSAMPNYSGNYNFVTAKANSHRVHVIGNGYTCKECHFGVVQNNTSISDRVRHANAFYNISFAPGRRGQAGKMYSSVWSATGVQGTLGGTCKNTTCHGTSTPTWGNPSTASCTACHVSNVADYDNSARVDGNPAKIYSTEWANVGHGRQAGNYRGSANAGANKTCLNCHRASVAHKDPLNPFRLYTAAQHVDDFCRDCHKVGGPTIGKSQTVLSHNSSVLKAAGYNGGANGWARWNFTPKCVDCHDPHGDNSNFMLHKLANFTSNSNKFGQWSTNSRAQLTFTSVGTPAWGDYVRSDFSGVCQRCHTPFANVTNFTKKGYNAGHNNGTRCTQCHAHDKGFKPGGESVGAQSCDICHGAIFAAMTSKGSGYHHVMKNTSALAGQVYRNVTMFGPTDMKSPARRCLMCHVDHDVFSPANNTARGVRAKNLRISASAAGVINNSSSFINTDFWPAKRKNAVRSGSDAGTANYSGTNPVMGKPGYNGVCISCHTRVQTKNTTNQLDNDKTSRARSFSIALYTSSSHNFQVKDRYFMFSSTNGRGLSFKANCTKCHRTFDINQAAAQNGKEKNALHDNNRSGLLNATGTPNGQSNIQTLCYKCHSKDYRPAYDYYSSIKMGTSTKLIKNAVTAKSYGHPIGESPGVHKADEFFNATSAQSPGSPGYPNSGWNRPGYNGDRHAECTDCHNTHGGNATIVRAVGSPDGNRKAGAQAGAWGIQVIYSTAGFKAKPGQNPRYQKKSQVDYQYELCMKCHSGFAYYTSFPNIPSGGVDMAGGVAHGTLAYDTVVGGMPETDVAKDFNPANVAYHPVVRKGRNQPPHSSNVANWLGDATNAGGTRKYFIGYSAAVGVALSGSDVAFQGVSGLGWNFVPPWSQKSTMGCSDCHQADNSGRAVQDFETNSIFTEQAGWTWTYDASNPSDKVYAIGVKDGGSGNAAAPLTANYIEYDANVVTPGGSPAIEKVWLVAIAKSGAGTTNNRKLNFTPVGAAAGTAVSVGAGTSYARVEAEVTSQSATLCSGSWTWSCINTLKGRVANAATTVSKNIDFAGIAVQYPMPGDLRGPHGSLMKWLLTDVDKNVLFDADGGGTLTRHATGGLGQDNPNQNLTDTKPFCFNCHRRDVYGYEGETPTYAAYSRASHPFGKTSHNQASYNPWGIGCMNCHGGRGSGVWGGKGTDGVTIKAAGGIHGIMFRTNTLWAGQLSRGTSLSSFKVLNRPLGVRLLYGATQVTVSDANNIYCYTLNTADALGTCGSEAGAMAGDSYTLNPGSSSTTNYTYTGW